MRALTLSIKRGMSPDTFLSVDIKKNIPYFSINEYMDIRLVGVKRLNFFYFQWKTTLCYVPIKISTYLLWLINASHNHT